MAVLMPGQAAVYAKKPPWAKIPGMTWKRYHYPGSKYQLMQQQRLAQAVSGLFGQGKTRVEINAAVASNCSGKIPGSPSAASRRAARHAMAQAGITARAAKIASMGATAV